MTGNRPSSRAGAQQDAADADRDWDACSAGVPDAGPNRIVDDERRRGRGARSNATGRYEGEVRGDFDDGWETIGTLDDFRTTVTREQARTIIATNDSPDISFDQSINPYRGCEHGCIYCYARPTHCYLGHSAGLDFETRLYAKVNAAEALEKELARPGYVPKVIALGAVTDPYQPIEREHRLSRAVLEVLERAGHPVGIVTKSALVVRDADILGRMAARGLAKVAVSVTTLDRMTARKMEPRAATPSRRLDAIRALSEAGVPVTVMVAPVVPAITDMEIEAILEAARDAGAVGAGYILLRMPLEIKELFREWLATEFPDRTQRVISLMQSMHGGRDYVSDFGIRQRGTGPYAELIARRFAMAVRRLGLNTQSHHLTTEHFSPPGGRGRQLSLF